MGLADAFGKDDRMEIKVNSLMNLMQATAKAEQEWRVMMNAVNCEVPYRYIREMVTGFSEDHEDPAPEDGPGEEIDIEDGYDNE